MYSLERGLALLAGDAFFLSSGRFTTVNHRPLRQSRCTAQTLSAQRHDDGYE